MCYNVMGYQCKAMRRACVRLVVLLYFIRRNDMWEEIVLSLGMSVAESIGCKYLEKKQKEKMLKKLERIVKQQFRHFADSSLDCNDFYRLIQSNKFIEAIRNLFLLIDDGMDRGQYFDSLEKYVYENCNGLDHCEVRRFLKEIEVLYKNYLHKMIEEYPGCYALFQLMNISHREIISKIMDSEENIKRYFENLEYKNIVIDDENIKLYHGVSQKEYSIIRFTGISGAERKKEQHINEFYVENSFSYYGKEVEKLYNCGLDEVETVKLENFFDIGNKIVLIGGAGLGKSTTLNYLFCNYEKMYGSYALKIKMDLKEYAEEIGQKKKSILWCISTEFSRRTKHTKLSFDEIQIVLSEYLEKGKCLIIFDALDEIPSLTVRNKVRDEIANFCEIYYLNRFIISTREAGYLRNRFDDTFLHIKINQFNIEQIKAYSRNWYFSYYENPEEFDEFWQRFKQEIERARCDKIISNPIILILALVIFDLEKNLPTRRIEFYEKCIETFLTERENRKSAYILDDKAKSILAMNLTVPKIAYYKFEHLAQNIGYKFNLSELRNAVFDAIGVTDQLNWSAPVNQYIEYLVDRTELVQEIDENIYDFVHKTFYEYFLAFYIRKMYDNEKLEELLADWIGDSNYDELARLIIESVIQNNEPKQHDYIMSSLFKKLEKENFSENMMDIMDIFSIMVDVYNHNMLQPKFYHDYNNFILNHSKCVDRINGRRYFRHMRYNQKVQYDAKAIAESFAVASRNKESMTEALDTLLYLNNDYKRQVISICNKEYILHIISIFNYVNEVSKGRVEESRYPLYSREINYFFTDGIEYMLTYPQVYLSVINLSLIVGEDIDVSKLLNYRFITNTKFYSYTNPDMLFRFIRKSQENRLYFAVFLISLTKCLKGRVNSLFEYILDINRHHNIEENSSNTEGERKFIECLWRVLNESKTFEDFNNNLVKMNVFCDTYKKVYEEAYTLYVDYDKGKNDSRIKKILQRQ